MIKLQSNKKPTAGKPKGTLKRDWQNQERIYSTTNKKVKSFEFIAVAKKGDKELKRNKYL